jgi:choline dehydrogenase-like flavoprotein
MLLDFRQAGLSQTPQADICVIGGGPAGIAIAREFANSSRSVILLESGGLDFDSKVQDLYKGINARGDFSLHTSRFRLLGGTTYAWGGWCTPLDDIDFERRDWVPDSGWPITKNDLLPYYCRAQSLCELGPYRYEIGDWPVLATQALKLDPNKLEHRLWQLSPPTRFGKTYLGELSRTPNITVLLNATATQIVTGENTRAVTEVRIASLSGARAKVRARIYIVACGGIETPRLLLLSNGVEANGVGNRHDLVGRYFMEHPHPDAGGVFISGSVERFRPYFDMRLTEKWAVLGFGPSRQAQERLQILNSSVAVNDPVHSEPTEAWDSLLKLSRAAGDLRWPENSGTHVFNVLRNLDDVIREGYLRVTDSPVQGFTFRARTETPPKPSNRVTLTADRDALGLHRVRLEWAVGALERTTVEKTMMLVAAELGRLEIGRVRVNGLLLEEDTRWSENLAWFGHHMGTTRMSENSKSGVVDTSCRVHGIANLYIAGSSVFPTSGFANPTLTILALALRLADHIRTIL